jgi:hypothetical protein
MFAGIHVTSYDVGDVSALPDLLGQIEGPVGSLAAGRAFDRPPVDDKALQRPPSLCVIIPRLTAVLSATGKPQRDRNLPTIEKHGHIGVSG